MKNNTVQGFTLVELIVVITIVGILSTVGFASYSNYLTGARDSNRITQMTKLSDGLQVYGATKALPLPDNKVSITASGVIIAYQWYAGTDVLEALDYSNGGKDPKDDTYFTYYVSPSRSKMQLLVFMEDVQSISASISQGYAVDYSDRYPKVYGSKIGVLFQKNTNIPLQEIAGIIGSFEHFTNTGIVLTSLMSDTLSYTASGYTLYGLTVTRLWEKAPSDCPDGFIGVPGNPEFNTTGFCVAQYEMTYSDADIPNSSAPWDWNTTSYTPWKTVVSMAWKYPVVDITQGEAIAACQSMGDGYHLITNNEWMTIARNIEATENNWSAGKVWQGNLRNGVSGDTNLGCDSKGGNIDPRAYATKTWPGNTSCNMKRSHTLTNGQIIWDLSGNVWEHANKANTLDGVWFSVGQTSLSGSSNPTWFDDNWVYWSSMRMFGSANGLGISNGMWWVYYSQWVANNIMRRWGHAQSGTWGDMAWVYMLYLDWQEWHENRAMGFRCTK